MKTGQTTLRSFEWITRNNGLGTLLVGGLVVIFVLRGHGGLYEAFRAVGVSLPSGLVGA
jgi:hypothetical protein